MLECGPMMKTYLLDGYNLIFSIPELEFSAGQSLELARDELFHLCDKLLAKRKDVEEIHIVFDGRSEYASLENDSYGRINVIYTATGQSADEVIVELLEHLKLGKKASVVSNDNFVRNHARVYGASKMYVSQFYDLIHRTGVKDEPSESCLSQAECDQITADYKRMLNI